MEGEATFESNRSCIWPDFNANDLPSPQLSLWRIVPQPQKLSAEGEPIAIPSNYFVAQPSFERPQFPVYALRNPRFEDSPSNTSPSLRHSRESLPVEHSPRVQEEQKKKEEVPRIQISELEEARILPIRVRRTKAAHLYANWVDSLWFAPAALRQQHFHEDIVDLVYLPYFLYDSIVRSHYTMEEMAPTDESDEDTEPVWNPISQTRTTRVCDAMAPAFSEESYRELMSDDVIGENSSAGQVVPIESIPQDVPLIDPYQCWESCQQQLEEAEANTWQEALRSITVQTRNFQIQTSFHDVHFRLLMIPVYTATFEHRGSTYRFVINATNGLTNGTRPFSLWNGIGSLWGKVERPGIYSGAELASGKDSILFEKDKSYLLFPPSKKSFFSSEVGWIQVKNKSSERIQFRAKERSGKREGIIFSLPPGETRFFPYRGHWTLEIVGGPASMLILQGQSPTGGTDHPDLLGMAS